MDQIILIRNDGNTHLAIKVAGFTYHLDPGGFTGFPAKYEYVLELRKLPITKVDSIVHDAGSPRDVEIKEQIRLIDEADAASIADEEDRMKALNDFIAAKTGKKKRRPGRKPKHK